jgi:hypothetical protein
MNEKLKNVNLIDELDSTFTDVKNQLIDDEKRWGDTWKKRGIIHNGVDQETRWIEKMRQYYEQYRDWGTPIPWEKVIGEAHIALVREKMNQNKK